MQRRLAAILAADVAGYTRLMGVDEAGTANRIMALRGALVEPLIARHRGRTVKVMGDGFLVEFASVVDALSCALAWQASVAQDQAGQAEDRQIVFRIGVNLGDVLVEDGDLLGDGVNIAARLESLAEPGSVFISGDAFRHVRGKLEAKFEDLGERQVKNIAEPLRVYRVSQGAGEVLPVKALALPDKPSLAVLPFDNMSGDPEQEFFADGITEDIITELSKFRTLFVIARNSSFSFKGKSHDVRKIATQLGVRYVVEGSVRRAGNRIRITAQLIDASEDKHIWAERYDRDLSDIFALQDEVTLAIVTAIEPQLAISERKRALRKPPENLDAWENYQRGPWYLFQHHVEEHETTLAFFRRAVALDPTFAAAHAALGYAFYIRIVRGSSQDHQMDVRALYEASQTAVKLDQHEPFAWSALARAHILRAEHQAAVAAADRAIALNPIQRWHIFSRAHALWHQGRPAEAIVSHDTTIRLSPNDPLMPRILASKAIALVMLGDFEKAVEVSLLSQNQATDAAFFHLAEISALGNLGRQEAATDAIARARLTKADLSIAYVEEAFPITDTKCHELFVGGMRKAGLPEK